LTRFTYEFLVRGIACSVFRFRQLGVGEGEKVLVPTLAKGDVVILDNLGSHKGKAARRAIRQDHVPSRDDRA